MPYNALATVPMIQKLTALVIQVWYADDAAACGKFLLFERGGIRYLYWVLA